MQEITTYLVTIIDTYFRNPLALPVPNELIQTVTTCSSSLSVLSAWSPKNVYSDNMVIISHCFICLVP